MTDYRKEFIKDFESLCYRHNRWTVWQNFIDMAALAIANSCELRSNVRDKREKAYLDIAKTYNKQELEIFAKLLADTTMALDTGGSQDLLGDIFMNFNFGGDHGQFFTPWNIAKLMSRILADSDILRKQIEELGYISVNDCACGAGCMLLAFADSCRELGINYQKHVLFIAQDIDPTVAKMCYIQLSLMGCPGYVVIGNSLTEPALGDTLFPKVKYPDDLWFTPFYYLRVWDYKFSALRNKNTEDKPEVCKMPSKAAQKEIMNDKEHNYICDKVQTRKERDSRSSNYRKYIKPVKDEQDHSEALKRIKEFLTGDPKRKGGGSDGKR